MSLPLALALYSVITVRTCWLLVFQPQLYNHLPSSRDHNRSPSWWSTYTRRTRLRIQQRKPNNSGCYWHQSLNTYLVRFGCPLLTKLVGYRRSNKVIHCCHISWRFLPYGEPANQTKNWLLNLRLCCRQALEPPFYTCQPPPPLPLFL